jgi:glycosyltransferase involved in cell wall biosynthesis
VIEAFASGTPVVATAVGGMREIIEDGTTGLLVPYGAAEELAEALRIVLDAPELRHKMSHHARQDAEAQYHEAVYKERIVSVTNELIRNGYHLSGA